MGRAVTPYGSWTSPFTADMVAALGSRQRLIRLDGDDVYWSVRRPHEGGRNALVRRRPDGRIEDVIPRDYNARSMVHEYGGGHYAVRQAVIWFSNLPDHRIYRLDPGGSPFALTPEGKLRFADLVVNPEGSRLYCVCEDHSRGDQEPENRLVVLDAAEPSAPRTVARGHDFYSSPALSADGGRIAWLSWDHPNMPWDGTELWVADLDADGLPRNERLLAGSRSESIMQPKWRADGVLHFLSDRTGFWNLYRDNGGEARAVCRRDNEFGAPAWTFGDSTYDFADGGRYAVTYCSSGLWRLAVVEPDGTLRDLDDSFGEIDYVQARGSRVFFTAESSVEPNCVVEVDVGSGRARILHQVAELPVDEKWVSRPQPIEYPTEDGWTAHAFYYAPHNLDFEAPEGSKPPLLVNVHGGPTGSIAAVFDPEVQYFTSRGFAYVDVDYRGSTAYGRAYRDALKGDWGVADVDDAINAARHLVERGLADPESISVRGGSAGGYTTLAAVTFRDFFTAGASYFGIADTEQMWQDTHKFESRYDIGLYGSRDVMRERSPIHFIDRVRAPLIIFQGLDDKVVPPNQAELMVAALRRDHKPFAYLPFAGEGHGFRQAANLTRSAEAELYFYSRVWRFEPGETLEPVEIENLS